MLLIFIICFKNVDCDIYNVLYCLYIECKINLNLSIYAQNAIFFSFFSSLASFAIIF